MSRGGALWGVCEFVQSWERECVIVEILADSSPLQTGDPGLETGHLRLLQGDKNKNFDKISEKQFTAILITR